ncbi:peptidoglycan DD-metalloendopeptidase family protein [Actinosynnema sp. CS-041913]|uniref:peptidoglycan DD-metalloendopeptidase family protein n=1 Tax=Actinosynnema sp. CS-041913 TaxID=3239917 RepID=UPI003D8BF222
MKITRGFRLAGLTIVLLLASSATTWLPVAQAAAPNLELPFVCGTSWTGNSKASSAHRNYEIDFNRADGGQDLGKPVLAAAAGRIREEGGASSAYGNYLEIDHGDGYSTLYAHLNTKEAHLGDTVGQGEQIGTVGNTDGSAVAISPHLHFEFRNRGSGQNYPDYIRPASFHGDPFDYASGVETYTSQNCGSTSPVERSGVAVVSRAAGQLDVFARDDDNSFLHKHFNGQSWSPWIELGGQFRSNPAANSGAGRIDLVGVGGNGTLWHKRWTSTGGWTAWHDNGGGQIQWTPALTSRGGNTLDAFSVNTSEQVVHRYFNGTSWSAWVNLQGSATAPPAAVALGNDRLNVLMRDGSGTLATRMWTSDHGWFGWVDRGERIFGQPAVSHRSDQLMDVFVRDDGDKSLMHSASTNAGTSFSAFVDLGGGAMTSAPAAVSWAGNRIDVFARAANGHLYQRIWTATHGWYDYVDIGTVG